MLVVTGYISLSIIIMMRIITMMMMRRIMTISMIMMMSRWSPLLETLQVTQWSGEGQPSWLGWKLLRWEESRISKKNLTNIFRNFGSDPGSGAGAGRSCWESGPPSPGPDTEPGTVLASHWPDWPDIASHWLRKNILGSCHFQESWINCDRQYCHGLMDFGNKTQNVYWRQWSKYSSFSDLL